MENISLHTRNLIKTALVCALCLLFTAAPIPYVYAADAASQFDPSASSPSPINTKTFDVDLSNLRPRAIPAEIDNPWPSAPVFVSIPGSLCIFGCPGIFESSKLLCRLLRIQRDCARCRSRDRIRCPERTFEAYHRASPVPNILL